MQFFLDAISTVQNTYSFIDFIVLADGRRYARVWDASQYPSLFTYVDGRLVVDEKMEYKPNEWWNKDMFAFHALAIAGATPYQSLGDRTWERLVRGSAREWKLMEAEIETLLNKIPLGWDARDLLPTIPRVTVGFHDDTGDEQIDHPSTPFPLAADLEFPWADSLPPN